ncbi:MAG: hypothetical protein ABUL46_01620 [Chitinophaga rupis]
MKKKRLFDNVLLTGLLVSLSCVGSKAQGPFSWHADLDTIRQAAFYKIPLSPEWVAKCRQDLGDLRILGGDGKFSPYVLRSKEPATDAYTDIPDPVIRQNDSSNQHSYLILQYGGPYRIDKVELIIQEPRLYKRHILVYDNEKDHGWPIAGVDIDPRNTSFRIPSTKTHSLLLDITNADNPPLVISRVATAQLDQYLVTYLQPGITYRLLAGNPQAGPPEYDLKYFVDSLTGDPQELLPGPIQAEGQATGRPVQVKAEKDHSGYILWGIILLVLLLLVSLSLKMVKATAQKDNHDRI